MAAEVARRVGLLRGHHEALEFRRAAAETRAIWALANAYLQERARWSLVKSDRDAAAAVTRVALNLVRLSATVAWSIIPDSAGKVLAALGDTNAVPVWPDDPERELLRRPLRPSPIAPLPPLVTKIDDEKIAHLEARFGGSATPK